jgi:hypothetical protein
MMVTELTELTEQRQTPDNTRKPEREPSEHLQSPLPARMRGLRGL